MYNGVIPNKREELLAIRGIGNYTSNAILCFGYNKPYAIVDTNVIRVFERFFDFNINKTEFSHLYRWEMNVLHR